LVSRNELMRRLWGSDTFVDFDHGLNKAVNRLREVLEDSAEHPRFIETLPRRGYRFIAPVERGECASPQAGVEPGLPTAPGQVAPVKPTREPALSAAKGSALQIDAVARPGRLLPSRSAPQTCLADLKGNAQVLWQFKGRGGAIWGVPSPDGRYLAIRADAIDSNVWMLEGF
jgi:hypothetical protein